MLPKILGCYLLIFLTAVSCLECDYRGLSCPGSCVVEYDKSFKFSICCGICTERYSSRYQIPEEDKIYYLFCDDSYYCKENSGPARQLIQCYTGGIDNSTTKNCSTCYIQYFQNGSFSKHECAYSTDSATRSIEIKDDWGHPHLFTEHFCHESGCNIHPYDHRCYSGYYGDCSWYLTPDKIKLPVEEECDRLHFLNGCVNQTLISNDGRICYMYGCHHKNLRISRAMFREEPRTARTLSNIDIDNGKANATQCYGSLCNIPTPPEIYCFERDGNLALCPKYTTSCRMYMYPYADDRKCTPISQTRMGCYGGICDCSGDGCNHRGIECYRSESSTTVKCGFNNYCQLVWDLSNQKIVSQGCVSGMRTFGCRYDENRAVYTCDCPFNNCNALGGFKCYQSLNDELGKLGPCPINTKGCRTIRDLNTKIVKARTCAPVEFPNYPKETKPEYEDCPEPGCNIWGNNGTLCYDSNSTEAISCPGGVLYCQTIWNTLNWAIEIQGCSSREENSVGCHYNQDKSLLICNCVGDKCNGFGDFKCYQSSSDKLGKLGPCPINTKTCRTIRNSIMKKIQSRHCLSEEFAKYPKENDDLQYEDCHEHGCNAWGNNGTVCYDSNLMEAISCPREVFYCQTIWSLWTPENITQGCPFSNPSSIGCHFSEDGTSYVCNCLGEECNKLGDFQCYQSFNHELGTLGPCPINTTGCRTLKDIVTNEIFARGCAANGLDGPLEEKPEEEGQFYDTCHESRCNNETVHGRWCPVGVKGRCFETWKNYLVPFHDLLPKPCYGFHDQCHTTKIKTSSGECTIHTCEFFDYNGNVDSTPAIEDGKCVTRSKSEHCVCEGDKCLDEVRTLLDMFMNEADGLHFEISFVGLILIFL